MAQAEVLPIVLQGQDNTASAWASFIRNGKSAQSVIDQLKNSTASFASGSFSSIGGLTDKVKLLANPYVAVTAVVLGLAAASIYSQQELVKLATAAGDIGTQAGNIAGLGEALKKVGGDGDVAIAALKNLRTQLDLNSRDGGYLENLFKLNGNSIFDAAGTLKPIEDIYKSLAGYILNAKNNTEAMEIATNAFGAGAAPTLRKAIEAGATSFDRIAKTDLDPLIKQSQAVSKIWDDLWKSDGAAQGWFAKLRAGFAQAGNNAILAAADILGSSAARNERQRINAIAGGTSAADQFAADNEVYQPSGAQPSGPYSGSKRTITPSNRSDPAGSAAFEKASIAVAKHTAEVEAQTKAVDLGAGALAQMETEAKLLATAQEAGLPVTDAMRDKIHALAEGAGDAAGALAKAKVASQNTFDRGAAFLTPQDLQIAQQLKGIYGTDIPAALNSSEAAAMRVNNALKDISSTGQDVTRGMFVDFGTQIRNGASAFDALKNSGVSALGKIADKLMSIAADGLWKAAFGGTGGGVLSLLGIGGAGAGGPTGFMNIGGYSMPQYASGTNNAPGGAALINEMGGEIVDLPSGSRVIPHDISMAMAESGGSAPIIINSTINAPNSDAQSIAQLASVVARQNRDLEKNVTAIMVKYRANTPGSNR